MNSEDNMSLEKHALLLGSILGNLQSLEFAIRCALYNHERQLDSSLEDFSLQGFKVGDEVPENALTDYSTLRELVIKYNRVIATGEEEKLDLGVVWLRDALAHGRISASHPKTPLNLLKFSKPERGVSIRVTLAEEMSRAWLEE